MKVSGELNGEMGFGGWEVSGLVRWYANLVMEYESY